MCTETKKIEFMRVSNDINGNPRYVCHFYELLNENDKLSVKSDFSETLKRNPFCLISLEYNRAVSKAKKIGGKRYRGKDFGGGVVFQSYNIIQTEKQILSLI